MAPREASGDGPVALPLDGQFQSCRPWRSEALETGVSADFHATGSRQGVVVLMAGVGPGEGSCRWVSASVP